jgi:hypothetical protein
MLNQGVTSTISAAALAASVAQLTAIQQSAFLSAGASFTQSPVIQTIISALCNLSTIKYLSSG